MMFALKPAPALPARLSRLLTILTALSTTSAWLASADEGGIEHHRVLWVSDPAREAVISWTTRSEGDHHRVHYDVESRGADPAAYRHVTESFKDGKFTMIPADQDWVEPGYYHHVRLTELEPATVYHLVIASDDQVSREFHFVTAADTDLPFAMLFGGDSRIGGSEPTDHNDRRSMNRRMAALVEEHPGILGLIHGGDYCQTAHWRFLDAWLSDHELTTTAKGRLLPIIPARGNHDIQIGFEEAFPLPEGTGNYYYSVPLSPEASILILNTEISLGGDQSKWLDAELGRLRPRNRWLLAAYHRPAFPSVRSMQDGASRRDHWVPLFEKHNLDLGLESHDHALKRTLPIRNGEPDRQDGIVYIGDGGLGVPQRQPDPDRWWFGDDGLAVPVHHVHLLEFGRQQLRIRAFGMDGDSLDDFTLRPRRHDSSSR